jgi:DnaJ-class molecular chaperone
MAKQGDDARTVPATSESANRNPGDEAAPGTPGTGEDVCPRCHGSGRIQGEPCPDCGGSGRVVRGIGGA